MSKREVWLIIEKSREFFGRNFEDDTDLLFSSGFPRLGEALIGVDSG